MNMEDCSEVTLELLLALKASAGPDRPVWLPDDSSIIIKSGMGGTPNLLRVDPETGLIERVTREIGSLPFLGSSLVDVSPDGKWISYIGDEGEEDGRERSSRVEIRLQSVEGAEAVQLTHLGANINAYSWSPDSRQMVLSCNRYGRYDVYKADVDSGEVKRLTRNPLYEVYPTFTPSGDAVLYVRLDDEWKDHEIISMTPDGGGARSLVKDEDFFDYHYGKKFGYPLVSPDGGTVIFPSHRTGWINYFKVPTKGGEPQPVHPEDSDQTEAALSPDGGSLALVSNSNGTKRLKVVPLKGDESARVVVDPGMGVVSGPSFSHDGKRIAYIMGTPTCPGNLWVVSLEDGESRRLTSPEPSTGLGSRLTPPEKVRYRSFDGLEIDAYLYSPPNRKAGDRFPGILYVHGGPTSQFSDTYSPQVQFLIRSGYVVLMPNIRGSSGYGKEFEDLNNGDWGHDDLRDVLAGVEFLRTLDYVDGENMGIHGTSYGGCMSMSAVGFAPGVFKAAVPHAGYGDWLDFVDEQELRHRQLLRYEFGDPGEKIDVYRRCSPIYSLRDATTPTFLVHGEGRYPRSDASFKFARALEQEYKTYEYKVYPGECYYVRSERNLARMYRDIVDFLDSYLKG